MSVVLRNAIRRPSDEIQSGADWTRSHERPGYLKKTRALPSRLCDEDELPKKAVETRAARFRGSTVDMFNPYKPWLVMHYAEARTRGTETQER
jgi:hypothetical protein